MSCEPATKKRNGPDAPVATKCTVVLGSQWGDEGKGKLVDDLSQKHDIVARCAGGANAGHTIVVDGKKYKFHLLPSGLISPKPICLIGNGVVLDVNSLFHEIDILSQQGIPNVAERVKISDRAHLVLEYHKSIDSFEEEERQSKGNSIGTTHKGIGPAYASKMKRTGVRVCDLVGDFNKFIEKVGETPEFEHDGIRSNYVFARNTGDTFEAWKLLADRLRPMVVDSVSFLHDAMNAGKTVLVEGANAALLDIDHGTFPYVTSSSCTIGGVCTGLGLPPSRIGDIIGIVKAYVTRVGKGPFPTELTCDIGTHLQTVGVERGTTTGRLRRCGWFDCVMLRYSTLINGYTCYNLTKLDVFTGLKKLKIAVKYECDGKEIMTMPADLDVLASCSVVYETMPGWGDVDISTVKTYADLPVEAKNYVARIEEIMGVPIRYVGVGPGRESTLLKE